MRISFREHALVFTLGLASASVLAWLFASAYRLIEPDALGRTFHAATVVYSQPPRLANIGFIWPPLPTVVQLPFVLVRATAREALAAPLSTAVFAALGLVVLNRLLAEIVRARPLRYLILAFYQTNAMIAVYSGNGMTELILTFWILVGIYALRRLIAGGSSEVYALTVMGISSGLGFLTRYEETIFAGVLCGACLLFWWGTGRRRGAGPAGPAAVAQAQLRAQIEGRLLFLLTPLIFSIALWLFFNWLITGSPVNFVVGRGSYVAQAGASLSHYALLRPPHHDVMMSVQYVKNLAWDLYPGFFLALPCLIALFLWRRDFFALGLALALISYPLFQVVMLFLGESFGWMRFIIYVIPLSIIALAYITEQVRQAGALPGQVCSAALVAVLVISSAGTLFGIYAQDIMQFGESHFLGALFQRRVVDNFGPDRAVAQYIVEEILPSHPEARILTDEQQSFSVILLTDAYKNFVTTRQPEFAGAVVHPQGSVDYILVPAPQDGMNLITASNPEIADGGAPFLDVVASFPGTLVQEWRLLRVLPAAP